MTWEDLYSWHFDFRTIYDLALNKARKDAVFVEIGCWVGKSIIYLATQAKAMGLEHPMIYAVDNWKGSTCDGLDKVCLEKQAAGMSLYQEFLNNVRQCGVEGMIAHIPPDTIPEPVSSEAAKYMPDGSCDLVFIDADHSRDAVRKDVIAWVPKVRPGGILAGHDINRQSVKDGVMDAFKELGIKDVFVTPSDAHDSWLYNLPG
jgi:hypothetical protein